jgi:hypothetical protein
VSVSAKAEEGEVEGEEEDETEELEEADVRAWPPSGWCCQHYGGDHW